MKRILLLTLLMVGCARSYEATYVDPDLQSYVAEFEKYYGKRVETSVEFKDLSDYKIPSKPTNYIYYPVRIDAKIVGLCKWSSSSRRVFIDPEYWEWASYGYRITLIFHELGHCELNRGHLDDTIDGTPVSIMNSYNFDAFDIDWDYYVSELF